MLPESELKRIKNCHPDRGDAHQILIRENKRVARELEAQLWYERLGKFAEMQDLVVIGGDKWYCMPNKTWQRYESKGTGKIITITTPELINEFLKIK